MTSPSDQRVRVAPLMDRIERDARETVRKRLVNHGMPAYKDEEIFERVCKALAHAADDRDLRVLLLPELLGDEVDWTLDTNLSFSSHRKTTGGVVLFVKRRILLPLTRWLFEYSQDNFRRQNQLNRILLACVEELAAENARLRRDLDARRQ